MRRVRLVVRTQPSQGWCTGSTPVRAAKLRDFRLLGTARAFKSDSITEGQKAQMRVGVQPCANLNQQGLNNERGKKMKKLLFIALVATGLLLVPVQRSDAQVTVGVGGVGIGFGYPGYRYGYYGSGYYPYGYYRPYPYYSYYSGPSYYWSNGHRYYRHHRHHHYYRY